MPNKTDIQKIKDIENKYGLVLFRMGLSHLVDVGINNLCDAEAIEKTIAQIMAQGEKDKAAGKIPLMTPEFQCDILRCSAELAEFSAWSLFLYVKKHTSI